MILLFLLIIQTKTSVMKLLLSFFAFFLAVAGNAQQVSGMVRDASNTPVSGATVSLLKDSTVAKLAVTNDKGVFTFPDTKPGRYKVSVSHVGFQPKNSDVFIVTDSPVEMPAFQLERSQANMAAVTVAARRPIVEVKADKTILNVEGTINATGSDALELLRKAPGVMVDKDDNLSVSGKNGVQVHIDGRPTPLAGQDLANYLKTLQASQIESIEIISNPSAKYEAAGNAGIINIKLKKNKSFGTNGSVNAGYNIGVYSKYNAGLSLNHRNKNINVYGNYNYNNSKNQNQMGLERLVLDTLFDQTAKTAFTSISHNVKAGIDYTLNKRSSVGIIANGSFSDPNLVTEGRTVISYHPTNTVQRILVAGNNSHMKRNNFNVNLNYNYSSPKSHNFSVNADRGYYDINTDQLQPNTYYDQTGVNKMYTVTYQMISPTTIAIYSAKADYDQPFAKGTLGVGGKFANISTDNDFQRFNVSSSGKELDHDRSNRFTYDESIAAGYVNYNRALKGMMIQAGLRVENTSTEGRSVGEKNTGGTYVEATSGFDRAYTDFFPSAAVTFNKNPMKQWNFTYSRRIDRPAYQDLNPFEFKLDEYTFQKGNTELRPQYTNSFGITHTYKYKLNATLNYSHVKDIFTQLIDTAERSKSFISKQNLATQDIVSLNISYPFMYKSFTSFVNMNTNHSTYKADFGEGRNIDLEAFAFNLFTQNSIKFGKGKTWTGEVTGMFMAPTIWQGAFRSKTIWGIDAGIQKQVMKGKGTFKLSMGDVFNTFKFRGTTEFAGQTSKVNARWESQQLKMNFTYRFGNSQVKAAKQRATSADEEAKRTQSASGINVNQ
jgi:iron complex outermembrane recepter protein